MEMLKAERRNSQIGADEEEEEREEEKGKGM